jgi:hypothetical protein
MSGAVLPAFDLDPPALIRNAVQWDPGRSTTSLLAKEPRPDEDPSTHDGAYGRFDGLFDVGLAVGAEVGDGTAGSVRASIHYYSMAGIYGSYSDAFGGTVHGATRLAAVGVDLRPAFIPRWSKDMEGSSPFLDLAIDSISLGLGAYWKAPKNAAFGDTRGLEFSFGFGLPLAAWAEGPWLGALTFLRWDDPGSDRAKGAEVTGLFTLGWHWITVDGES